MSNKKFLPKIKMINGNPVDATKPRRAQRKRTYAYLAKHPEIQMQVDEQLRQLALAQFEADELLKQSKVDFSNFTINYPDGSEVHF